MPLIATGHGQACAAAGSQGPPPPGTGAGWAAGGGRTWGGKLAALVSNNGTWKGRQIIDPDVLDLAWSGLQVKRDLTLHSEVYFTKGGFGVPGLHKMQFRDHMFMGWGGAGGSIIQANRAGVAFAYVPNTMQVSLRSRRAYPLIEAILKTASEHSKSLRDD